MVNSDSALVAKGGGALARKEAMKKEAKQFPIMQLDWTGSSDLVAANETIPENLAVIIHDQYSTINISSTFKQLVDCGDLLRVALAKAGHQPCSVSITKVLGKFQDLCNDSCCTTSKFVDCSVAALKAHKFMFRALDKKRNDLAMKQFGKTGDLAAQMSELASKMEQKAGEIKDLAQASLEDACKDKSTSEARRREIENQKVMMQAAEARISSLVQSLNADIKTACEDEEKLAKAAAEQRSKEQTMQMLQIGASALASLNPFGSMAKAADGVADVVGAVSEATGRKPASRAQPATGADCGGGSVVAGGGSGGPSTADVQDQVRAAKANLIEVVSNISIIEDKGDDITKEEKDELRKLKARKDVLQAEESKLQVTLKQCAESSGKRADSLEEKEANATAHRRSLEAELRDQNSALVETLSKLSGLKSDLSQVEQSVACLVACVQTLGKIRTTFENVRMFWDCVANHSKSIATSTASAVEEYKEEPELFEEGEVFRSSAINWAALGQVNLMAHAAMVASKKNTDSIMGNIPNPDDPSLMAEVNLKCQGMIKAIEAENVAIADAI